MRLALAASAAALGLALAAPAAGQGMPPPQALQAIDWNGFYGGVVGGGVLGRIGRSDLFASPVAPAGLTAAFAAPINPAMAAGATTATGGAFGGVFGFQRQYGTVVFGLEGDLMWLGLKGGAIATRSYSAVSRTTCGYVPIVGPPLCPLVATNLTVTERQALSVSQSFLSTGRARLGATFGSTMVYVTGGLAVSAVQARLESTVTVAGQTTTRATTNVSPRVGYAVGLGAEHMVTGNIALRAEWLYYSLGSVNVTNPALTLRSTVDGHLLRAGLLLRL